MNSLPKTVTGQRRDCDLNPGPSAPESGPLSTQLPSHPRGGGNQSVSAKSTNEKPVQRSRSNWRILRRVPGACSVRGRRNLDFSAESPWRRRRRRRGRDTAPPRRRLIWLADAHQRTADRLPTLRRAPPSPPSSPCASDILPPPSSDICPIPFRNCHYIHPSVARLRRRRQSPKIVYYSTLGFRKTCRRVPDCQPSTLCGTPK